MRAEFPAQISALANPSLAFAAGNFWFILFDMQSQNGSNQGRRLRDHLSQIVTTKQQELERTLSKSATTTAREDLFAEVSREAVDVDYERWDGMS